MVQNKFSERALAFLDEYSYKKKIIIKKRKKTKGAFGTNNRLLNMLEWSKANVAQAVNSLYEPLKVKQRTWYVCWKYQYPSINKTWQWKHRLSVSLYSAMFGKMSFVVCFSKKAWVSESQHMEPSHLLRLGHLVTVGTAQCDRCYCRPARRGIKTIPLICHLILLSTGLQSQSMHNMLLMHRHLEILGLVGWKNIPHVYWLMGFFSKHKRQC